MDNWERYFFHSVGCCHFAVMSFGKYFSFPKSHSLTVGLSACATSLLFRKSFPAAMSSNLFPTFWSIRFSVFLSEVEVLIHFELRFMLEFVYIHYDPVWPALFVEGAVFSPMSSFSFFVKNQGSIVLVLQFTCIDQCVCFMLMLWCLYCYSSMI